MIYRIFTATDTYVTNYWSIDLLNNLNLPATGSNVGAAEVLEVFKEAPVSGAVGYQASASIARSLIQFDLTQFGALTASNSIPNLGLTWHLMMKQGRQTGTLPSSFAMEICAVTQSWSAGAGLDTVLYSDKGVTNWVYAQANVPWDGGNGPLGIDPHPFFFTTGHEDLDVDVTSIVNQWLTGSLQNNGLLVRLSSTLEADGNDYYSTIFHGTDTHYDDWRPCLEARWDDSVKDDRNNIVFGVPGKLYLYNLVQGQFTDLPNAPQQLSVQIQDLSGTQFLITGSWTGLPGIYSASLTLPSGSYSGSTFFDIWCSGSYLSGTSTTSVSATLLDQGLVYYSSSFVGGNTIYSGTYVTSSIVYSGTFISGTVYYAPSIVTGTYLGPFPFIGTYVSATLSSTLSSTFLPGLFYSGTFMTGTFNPSDNTSKQTAYPPVFDINIPNLQNQYRPYEVVRMNVFSKNRNYNPPVVMGTASSDYSSLGQVFTKGYWQIENDRTDMVVIPFGTGSVETTRLSYDQRGNWFRLYMSSLSPANVYRVTFLVDVNGESRVIDSGFKFRVGYDTQGVPT